MKKQKKVFLVSAVLIIVSVLFLIGAVILHNSRYQDQYIYETTDEVIELFENNISDFDNYVERFNSHDMWDNYYEETKDSDFVNYKGFKKYTTSDEFDFLDEFSDKYHPTFWGRKSLGFYVRSGSVQLIKDELLTEHTQFEINRAEDRGAIINYYENGWIGIIDSPSPR